MAPRVVDAASFDAAVASSGDELVVVDFHGPSCPNCEVFVAALPDLLADLHDVRFTLLQCDAYANPSLAERFSLHGVPTFILLRRGRVLGRMSGYRGRAFFTQVVREHAG